MNIEETVATIKKMGLKKIMYPLVMGLFFLTAAVLFFFTVQFMVRVVNKVFTIDERAIQSRVVEFDIETFERVKKRFNLIAPGESLPTPLPSAINSPGASPSVSPSPSPTPVLDKAALKLHILNGSTRNGQAGILQRSLRELGFTQVTTATAARNNYPQTIIQVKESKRDYMALINEGLVGYELGSDETLTPDSQYDMIIIIGAK